MLALLDFVKEIIIECDASGKGVCVILMQGLQPIAYFSQELSPHLLSLSAYEAELMAFVLAKQHRCTYLLGQKFLLQTNHWSLKHLLQQDIIPPSQQNWVSKCHIPRFSITE